MASTAEGGVAFFGGGLEVSLLSDTVDVFDAMTGTWSVDFLSLGRYQLAAGAEGGKVVFAGGIVNDFANPSDRVDIYDMNTGSWTTDQLPQAAHLMAAASVDGRVFFAGGLTGSGALSTAQVYDVATGNWSMADLQFARWDIAAAQDDRRVFFAGGTRGVVAAQTLNIYDSVTNTWSTLTMPHAHSGAGAVVVDGKLFVGGGVPWWRIVDIYDIATGQWEIEYLPTERSLCGAAGVGPFAIFAGGFGHQSTLPDTADVYNSLTKEWSTVTLSTAAWVRGVAVLEDEKMVMFAGGRTNPASLASTDLVDVFKYLDPLGTSYCGPANPNSTGQPAEIKAIGAELAADSFVTLTASHLPPDQAGLFLASQVQAFLPFAGGSQGNLCLGSPFGRYANDVQSSGSDGSFSLSVDLTKIPLTPPHAVVAGETWNFQAWFRDLNPGPTSNFTDAVSIAFL